MKKFFFFLILVFVGTFSLNANASDIDQNKESSELTVLVTDTVGTPIFDAQIYIEGWGYTYTDYDGYAYIVLDNGTYSLYVSHYNYYPDTAILNLTSDTTITFRLVRFPEVVFHITDTLENPIQWANVEINWYMNYTDENGNAYFYLDTSENYFAFISHDFYYPDTMSFQVHGDTVINVMLTPKPMANFYVTDTNNNAISYASIDIDGMYYETDYDGYIQIPLDTGYHYATVYANGYFSKYIDFYLTNDTTIYVQLIKLPALTLYVRDTADNPLPYANVQIDWDYYSTDENGVLIVNLYPNDYEAIVFYNGYFSDTLNFTITKDTSITVHLVPLPLLTIHVTDESGTPLQNAYAEIDYSYYYANENGDIIANLYPGTYQATVYEEFHRSETINFTFTNDTTINVVLESLPLVTFHISDTLGNPVSYPDIVIDGYWYNADEEGIATIGLEQGEHFAEIYSYGYQSENFYFTVNQDTDIYVQLIPYPEMTFRVTDTAGYPVPYAFVEASGGTNAYTDSNGICVLKVPPTEFDVYVYKSGYYDNWVFVTYQPDTIITVQLTPISLAVFYVKNSQGIPIAGATIYTEFGDITKTDSLGVARMALYSGYYTAITEFDCYTSDTTYFETYENQRTDINITLWGGAAYNVTFNVIDENNTPIANALVVVDNDTLITDNQGVAEIQLWCNQYSYKVITTCGVYTGSFTVQGDDLDLTLEINCTFEKPLQTEIFAYPNPVENVLHIIHKQGSEMTVSDINGKILLKAKIYSNYYELDMTDFQPGIYLIRLKQMDKSDFVKIIKR